MDKKEIFYGGAKPTPVEEYLVQMIEYANKDGLTYAGIKGCIEDITSLIRSEIAPLIAQAERERIAALFDKGKYHMKLHFSPVSGEEEKMTKQEEIRKGIEKYTEAPAALWAYLHSQGVVIKVDREYPDFTSCTEKDEIIAHQYMWGDRDWYASGQGNAYDVMTEAGYVAVEPLIGEAHND